MRFGWGAVVVFVLSACGRSPEAIERARVLVALDALRDAPAGDIVARRRLLAALEQTPAVAPDNARARDTCVVAYRLILDGTELQNSVRAALAREDDTPGLAARLLESSAKIHQADTVLPDCERAIADVRLPGRH